MRNQQQATQPEEEERIRALTRECTSRAGMIARRCGAIAQLMEEVLKPIKSFKRPMRIYSRSVDSNSIYVMVTTFFPISSWKSRSHYITRSQTQHQE